MLLDIFMNSKAFDYCPGHACVFYMLSAFVNLFYCPDLSIRDVMQRGDHARATRLPDILQADRIVRSIPPHGLFHQIHVLLCLRAYVFTLSGFHVSAGYVLKCSSLEVLKLSVIHFRASAYHL